MVLSGLRWGLWGAPVPEDARVPSPAENPAVGFSAVAALPAPSPVATCATGPPGPTCGLYLPAGSAPAPVVVLVHGGCWLNAYGLDHIRAPRWGPRGRGLCGVVPGISARRRRWWRLARHRERCAGGGRRPNLRALLRALRSSAPRRACHSAGGHLALWLASHWPDPLPAPKLALGLAPITDLPATPRVIIPARWPRPSSLGAAGAGAGGLCSGRPPSKNAGDNGLCAHSRRPGSHRSAEPKRSLP